jgi:hypothetical protein
LRIEAYFHSIQDKLTACPVVRSTRLTFDKRSSYEGFIRGEIFFIDDSILHIREYVTTEDGPDRLTYAYQYMTPGRALIFRYDNTGHHKRLNLPTYPHHKHEGAEDQVISSAAPTLAEVLSEIELMIDLT